MRRQLAFLQSGEFLYETRLFPDAEYTFKHALTQEVAYGGLLTDRRRAIHARIVEAIERLQGDRPAEQVERLAHHALHAELWEKARQYGRQAAAKAMARWALRDAATHLEQALTATKHLPKPAKTSSRRSTSVSRRTSIACSMASRVWGKMFRRREGLLEMSAGIPQRPARHRLGCRLSPIEQCLVPQLRAQGVMGEPLDLLPQSVALESLDRFDDPRVDGAPAIGEEAAIRHLLRQRVLERVLRIGKEAGLIEKLPGLQKRELAAHALLRLIGDGVEQDERDVLSDNGGRLQQLLLRRWEPVDPGGQDGLDRGRNMNSVEGVSEAIGPALSDKGLRFHEGPHALFQKERVAIRPLDEQGPQRGQLGVGAQQRLQEILGPFAQKRVDAELRVVGAVAPGVLVLGAIGDEEQETGGGEAVDQAVEPRLGLGINPVQILEDHEQRLDLALAEDEVPRASSVCWRRWRGSSACHRASSTGTPRRASKAAAAGHGLSPSAESRALIAARMSS